MTSLMMLRQQISPGQPGNGRITIGVGVKAATIWRAAALLQDEHPIGEISRDATSGDRSPPNSSEPLNAKFAKFNGAVREIVRP